MIPDSVTSIGSQAFKGCTFLTIYCEATSKPSGWDGNWNAGNSPVVWDCNKTDIADDGYIYAIVDGVRYALKDDQATVAEQPRSIGGDIAIPESVTYNGKSYSVTSIGNYAFSGCSGLTSITIPDGVTSIGNYTFSGCSGLTSVIIPDGVTSIGNYTFSGCSGLTSITIPDSVTSIGSYAFSGCSGLTSITIPDSVTSISSYAFNGCSGLTSITVEEGNEIYHSAGNCLIETKSKTLTLGCKNSVIPADGSLTSIGTSAFGGCSGLTSITIPDSVTSIGDYAFDGCSGLTSITIPDSVTSIGFDAFRGCSGLTSVIFQGTMQQWEDISKRSNWNNDTGSYTVTCTDGVLDKDGQHIS